MNDIYRLIFQLFDDDYKEYERAIERQEWSEALLYQGALIGYATFMMRMPDVPGDIREEIKDRAVMILEDCEDQP